MDTLKIVLTYKSSKNNKKLLEFIRRNLHKTVDQNYKYNLTIAYSEDKDYYAKKGITSFPCISFQEKRVCGADRIISFIQELVRKRVDEKQNKPTGEMLDDYFKQSLGGKKDMEMEGDEESANPDDMGKEYMSKIQMELDRRQLKKDHLKDLNTPAMSEVPPSQRKEVSSSRTNNVEKNEEVEIPVSDAVKSLKPKNQQEASDDALMAKFFENQMADD